MVALEKELLERELVVDGKIPPEKGQEAADLIRDTLRPYVPTLDINGRNIALFVVKIDGIQSIVIGISGEKSPGAAMPSEIYFTDRKADSENKIIHEVMGMLLKRKAEGWNPDVQLTGYTEQKPCKSCTKTLLFEAPKAFEEKGFTNVEINKTTYSFNDAEEREDYVRSRYKEQKRGNQ